VVAQGLLQYLAIAAPKPVWSSFGSWLRTIRPDIPPSEFVVAKALRQTLPEFLMGPAKCDSLTKFIVERQDMQNMPIFRLASQTKTGTLEFSSSRGLSAPRRT
jgi:hypothetical protein